MRKQLMVVLSFLIMLSSFAMANDADKVYKIENIIIENLREVPQNTILAKMSEKKGDVFSSKKMLEDYKTIKSLAYIENVMINPKYNEEGVDLVVRVQEKKEAKDILKKSGVIPNSEKNLYNKSLTIKAINVYGNLLVSKKEILSNFPVKVGNYYSEKKIAEGYRNIVESGDFRQVIPDIRKEGNKIVIDLHVSENPVITGVNILGSAIFSEAELKEGLKTKANEVLNYAKLKEDREAIMKKYNKEGYVLAEIIDIRLNSKYELDIILSEGMIDNIDFKKMATKQRGGRRAPDEDVLKSKDYLITREITLERGTVFDIDVYNETVRNLMRLGYIKNVKYETQDVIGAKGHKNVVLLIEEDRSARIQGAISYGSELGLLGTLALEENNWKGRGQRASLSFEKSDDDYTSFSLDFSDPWIKDTDRISWGWSLYRNEYETSESEAFSEIITHGFGINIGKGLTRNLRLNLGLKAEYVETAPDSDLTDAYIVANGYYEDEYWLYSLTPAISYDTRNNYLNPTKGFYSKFGVEVGHAGGIDEDDFINTTAEARLYHKGFGKKNTFAYRLSLGHQSSGTKESQRYWVGGSSSVRGYEGGTYKGRDKAVLNLENRTQFNDVLGLVFFVDAGRAWNYDGIDQGYTNNGETKDEKYDIGEDLAVGAGVGLRINTPMGPLRFDFGWPIGQDRDGDGEDDGMQFYFNMGQSF